MSINAAAAHRISSPAPSSVAVAKPLFMGFFGCIQMPIGSSFIKEKKHR